MAELVVSYLINSTMGKPHGKRVWADGQVESYTVTKTVRGADGKFHDEKIAPGWYPIVRLSEAQVASIQKSVDGSGLSEMPAEVQNKGTGSSAKKSAEWHVGTENGVKSVKVANWPPTDSTQILLDLSELISSVVSTAQAEANKA